METKKLHPKKKHMENYCCLIKKVHPWFVAVCQQSFNLIPYCMKKLSKDYWKINLMAGNTPHLTKFISSFNPNLLPYYSVENFHWIIPDIGKIY